MNVSELSTMGYVLSRATPEVAHLFSLRVSRVVIMSFGLSGSSRLAVWNSFSTPLLGNQ